MHPDAITRETFSDTPPEISQETRDFFAHLWRGGRWAHYWTPRGAEYTDGDGESRWAARSLWLPSDNIPTLPAPWRDRDVYFSVNPTHEKRTERHKVHVDEVAAANCLFADFDAKAWDGGKPAILAHLDELPRAAGLAFPSAIVDSGGGYHCYWLLENPFVVHTDEDRAHVAAVQAAWVELVGSDPAVKDLARVLRVPGTYNHKYDPARLVEFVEYNPRRLFPFELFDALTATIRAAKEAEGAPPVRVDNTAALGLDDTELLNKAMNAPTNGDRFTRLWGGDLSTAGGDHSAADQALVNLLAFWTGKDEARMDRLFRQSGLYRPKWEREDYRRGTIDRAIQDVRNVYDPTKAADSDAVRAAMGGVGMSTGHTNGTGPHMNGAGPHANGANGTNGAGAGWASGTQAIWRNADADVPVTIRGYFGRENGVDYYQIEGSDTGIPAHELFSPTAPTDGEDEDEAHPLDVATPPLALGWIDEYADLMTKLTGSPREFNQVCGLVTAAAAIQRKARLRMSFADIYPNIYAAIVARSSVYHKSSALHKPRALFQRAMLDRLMLSELMTSEGLLAQLQSQSAGLVVRDEIGTLFDSHRVKYLRTLKPDLTALYDCQPYSRRLSNLEIKVDAPYLNILGATTPARFYDAITATDWQDGFMARWLFVLPEGEPDFDAMTGLYEERHDAEIGRLAVTLQNLDRQREQDFALAGDAFTLWDGWQRQAAKDAYFYGDDTIAAVVTRYSAYALKFALILAAVNGDWGRVTLSTMQTAIHLADSYKRSMARLLREKNEHLVSGAQLQKVFKAIQALNTDGKGVVTKTILQRANMRKAQLTPCLEKLTEIGAIAHQKVGNGFRYWAMTAELPIRTWN